jgi:hypothetical protein
MPCFKEPSHEIWGWLGSVVDCGCLGAVLCCQAHSTIPYGCLLFA